MAAQKPVRFKESLTESVYSPGAKVDRENKVIRHVKILGKDSRNQREYTSGARTEAAAHYEGMTVNLNHPTKEAIKRSRGIEEKWGWLEGITDEADGVYGDLHYLEAHQYTPQLLELAERNPKQFGLSHNADCAGHRMGRKEVIESVPKVRSVDVVQRPATTSGLFEEEEETMTIATPKKRTIKTLLEAMQEGSKKRKRLLAILEMDGMADMGITPDMAVEGDAPAEGESSDPMKEAIKTMILAILDQDLPSADAIAQITHVLEGPSAPGGSDTATPATEGVDELRKELKAMKNENAARAILEEADIKATGGRLKSVIAVMEDEDELDEVLTSFPKRSAAVAEATPAARVAKPKFSRPLVEESPDAEPKSALAFTDSKSFAAAVR